MTDRQPIPNINIGQVYDQRYSDAEVHYDKLGNLAGFFGRNMPVHRHDRFFQVHYVKAEQCGCIWMISNTLSPGRCSS
jgi:AraC family 4-hydroxyphenylacetate 3-monooxygenase operon regulatory protein